MSLLNRDFYTRHAGDVAHDLLGCRLVRETSAGFMAGIIVETEAYQGEDDLGCHAHVGKTVRNAQMFGAPGYAYIYFTYGMHWLLNLVTSPEDVAAAVLIRTIIPVEGCGLMAYNRPNLAFKAGWLNGPAKITQALQLNGTHNGLDLCLEAGKLRVECGLKVPVERIETTPRIGLNTVPEPWKSIPWRFTIDPLALEVTPC